MNIQSIKAYSDNYIWLITTNEGNLVIDPGEAAPVIKYMQQNSLKLTDILITHHHYDHVGGVIELKKDISGKVIGPQNDQIEGLDQHVVHNDEIESCGLKFEVIEIPGHTLDHIAYFLADNDQPRLFCGDTLFSGGCGRVFEGTNFQMYQSLERLQTLPSNTLVYCGHEYTISNLKFAKEVEASNVNILEYIEACQLKLAQGLPTLPSTLETEQRINPFMRCAVSDLRQSISHKMLNSNSASDSEIFSYLREWKDSF